MDYYRVQIRLGVVNLVPKVDDKIRPIDVNITECKVITHPSFKLSPFKTHSNDIALIRMKKAVNLTGGYRCNSFNVLSNCAAI